MKIVHEKLGRENFLELSVTEKEIGFIKNYMIISKEIEVYGMTTTVGIKLEMGEELYEDFLDEHF